MINGVDYASIDNNKPPVIPPTGIGFAIVRGAYTYLGRSHTDPHLSRDRDSWQNAGVPFGSYLILGYAPDGDTPEQQVAAFIAAYNVRREGELPPSLDVETNSADHSFATDNARRAWVERAYDAMVGHYGIVMIYTSVNQWSENFGNKPSRIGGAPLWIKVPYAYRPGNPPHPESCPAVVTSVPVPWQGADSPGAWLVQYQGDAKGVPGFSSTVDLNGWLPKRDSAPGLWVRKQLARKGYSDIRSFQKAKNLATDGVIGPKTFAVLTA